MAHLEYVFIYLYTDAVEMLIIRSMIYRYATDWQVSDITLNSHSSYEFTIYRHLITTINFDFSVSSKNHSNLMTALIYDKVTDEIS